jgi:hypothetical protein
MAQFMDDDQKNENFKMVGSAYNFPRFFAA